MPSLRNSTYLLGIDAGTTSLKSAIYDLSGNLIAIASQEYPTFHPQPGWAEHSPTLWWDAVKRTLSRVLEVSTVPPDQIAGVCVSALSPAVVPIDKDGKPLRPAIIWMDTRGGPHNAAPKLQWIRENQPEVVQRAHKILLADGYINYKLTGQYTADPFQVWWNTKEAMEKFADIMDKFPETKPLYKVIGEVTSDAAKETGLAAGTPVVQGSADGIAAWFGGGLVKPGRTGEFTGQSAVIMTVTDKEYSNVWGKGLWCFQGAIHGTWVVGGPMSNGGGLYKWFRDKLGYEESEAALMTGLSPFEIIDIKASKVQAGSDNLIVLPYFNGERAPIWDPNARGVIFGLSNAHTKAHVARALMESVAYGFRHIVEQAEETGVKIGEVRSMGGGSKSRLWLQIKADVLGKTFQPVLAEAEPLGDAILAGLGVGIYKDPVETCERLVRLGQKVEPNMANHERYTKLYKIYRKLYVNVKPLFDELAMQ